jgi:RND family efflux transporter MFP subunit
MRSAARVATVLGVGLLGLLLMGAGQPGPEQFRGLLEPSDIVDLSSQTPGIIEEVLVERGDRVRKGQVLVRLKDAVEKATVDLAMARLEFGRRKVQRNEELYQKELISIHEKDEMETEVKLAEVQLREATERLKLRTIASPVDGVVTKKLLSAGEYVGEGSIMTIARIDPINVEVFVPTAMFRKIRKGMVAEIRPEAPVGGLYRGRVVVVDEVIDAASGTFGVRAELPNPEGRVNAGLNCTIRFLAE